MRTAPCLLAFALFLQGCLESDEEIAVRTDGSVAIEVSARAKEADLANGYPLPSGGPWSDATRKDAGDGETEVRTRAEFRTVGDVPSTFAPESEPYRTAFLERASGLSIERRGGRTVYAFERTYRGRPYERHDLLARLEHALPEELFAKVKKDGDLDDAERATVAAAAVESMRAVAASYAGDAGLSVFTHGDASLSAASLERVRASVAEAVAGVVTRARLDRIVLGVFPPAGVAKEPGTEEDADRLEKEIRETLRSSFEGALRAEAAPVATRNAMRGELEWLFTSHDHTDDLGDDTFHVGVRMPGTIVGGNFDALEDGAARWTFEGSSLRDRDRVLRVVSVVE